MSEGDDLGKWLQRHKNPGTWAQLSPNSRSGCQSWACSPLRAHLPPRRPLVRRTGPSKAQAAFQQGLAALTQWVEQEGADRPIPRGHGEPVTVDGEEEPVIVKLGVWISNTKTRRDKLTP